MVPDGAKFALFPEDLTAIALTLKLAFVSTVLLLLLGTPLAWWLANTRSRLRPWITALVALPLVLPPTVLGFYLLLFLGANGPLGSALAAAGLPALVFTFPGLVLGSVIYSLPFVVQPIQAAIEGVGRRPLEVAATLRASPWDAFRSVVLPLAAPGFLRAAILGFAHTVGEFGVVLMIGGSIAGETRVVSVQLYEHVESLHYGRAHALALILVVFSFLALALVSVFAPDRRRVSP